MAAEESLDLEHLKIFLKICEIKDNLINEIIAVCKSVEDLVTNFNAWSEIVNKEEKIKIVKCASRLRYAKIEAEEFCLINDDKDGDILFEEYYSYAQKYGKEVDEEIEKYKRELYELALKQYLKNNNSLLVAKSAVGFGSEGTVVLVDFLKDVIPKIAEISKSSPGFVKGIASVWDEVAAYCTEITLNSTIRGNMISGALMFGIMTVGSIATNVWKYFTGKISGKQCLTLIGIDFAANGASTLTTTALGIIGSLVGSLIFPGVGTLIGGMVGSLIGTFIGNIYVDPLVKRCLAGDMLCNSPNIDLDCQAEMDKLYDSALKEFNVTRKTPMNEVKKLRRTYILCFHPDKQDSLDDIDTQRFIHLEACYKIIEKKRIVEGTWK